MEIKIKVFVILEYKTIFVRHLAVSGLMPLVQISFESLQKC